MRFAVGQDEAVAAGEADPGQVVVAGQRPAERGSVGGDRRHRALRVRSCRRHRAATGEQLLQPRALGYREVLDVGGTAPGRRDRVQLGEDLQDGAVTWSFQWSARSVRSSSSENRSGGFSMAAG
ncbi:hypothetical protein GCM10009838_08490 [Catenulispora subtropica]|uniref:Uncharacterized protein n=1 Tax=Catenulispora subtropica TaxID=450798 RepID=A0ABN2QMH9_9ACTN